MSNERLIKRWHGAIMKTCEQRLGRTLTPDEARFIRSRESFIALEIIEDTVNNLDAEKLVKYLNSESHY